MSVKKSNSSKSKLVRKAIALLLTLQIILLGIQGKERIQDGDSVIEVLLWMIGNCISLLKETRDDDE